MNLQETQVASGATASKGMSYAEEKALEEKIRQLQDAQDGVEVEGAQGVSHEVRDRKILDRRLSELKKIQSAGKIERAVGPEREKIEKEEELLRKRLDPKMSWDDYSMTQRKHGIRYQRLVQQIIQWNSDQKRQADIRKWKELRRRLDPDDPNAANVMNLFNQ